MSVTTTVTRARRTDPVTSERIYNADETEFVMAMQAYKDHNRRLFPNWSEALTVLLSLGYRKVAPGSLPQPAQAPAPVLVLTPTRPPLAHLRKEVWGKK